MIPSWTHITSSNKTNELNFLQSGMTARCGYRKRSQTQFRVSSKTMIEDLIEIPHTQQKLSNLQELDLSSHPYMTPELSSGVDLHEKMAYTYLLVGKGLLTRLPVDGPAEGLPTI